MEESRNGFETDNTSFAIEIFERTNGHINGTVWERYADSTETGGADDISDEQSASMENESAVEQHLVSSVVFTRIDTEYGYEWILDNVWDNVSVRQLDDIGQNARYEWHPVNYSGPRNILVAMAENPNVILLRTIINWSRLDGNVWSEKIVWSGSFADGHRVLQLLEDNSDSIQLIGDRFDLHAHLRGEYIARHESYPTAAAMAAVETFPMVIIPVESGDTGDGEGEGDILLCAICHDMLSTGIANRLSCNHLFHRNCLLRWFYLKLECPLCRGQF